MPVCQFQYFHGEYPQTGGYRAWRSCSYMAHSGIGVCHNLGGVSGKVTLFSWIDDYILGASEIRAAQDFLGCSDSSLVIFLMWVELI